MGRCDGRVALVTGASRGIGAAIAVAAGRGGRGRRASPPARSTRTPTLAGTLPETAAAIEAAGGARSRSGADLADGDDRARIVPEVEAALGPVDILVNNAAAAFYLPTAEMTLKRRRLLFELNVHAPVDLAQAVVPGMRERGEGWIVNISSATSTPTRRARRSTGRQARVHQHDVRRRRSRRSSGSPPAWRRSWPTTASR